MSTSPKILAIAVLTALFGSSAVHAMNVGQANIESSQDEPLSATIAVTDIDAKNFSVSMAQASIYQQMEMTPDASISASFTPTSPTSGKVVLRSSKPIATPFTDVVLNLNNAGKQETVPQTLLLPIAGGNIAQASVGTPVEPNLPVVSAVSPEENTITANETTDHTTTVVAQPLSITEGAPPPFIEAPSKTVANTTTAKTPSKRDTLSEITPEAANTQGQILIENITRHAIPAGSLDVVANANNPENNAPIPNQKDETTDNQDNTKDDGLETQASTGATYVVQRNDNLWVIANTIAKANNLSIPEVMKKIQAQNPDAFVGNKASQLRANVTLKLPKYDVIPSQKAIEDAISARNTAKSETKEHNDEKALTAKNNTKTETKGNKRSKRRYGKSITAHTSHKKVTKALPTRSQMTLVTAGQGSGNGTQDKGQGSAVSGNNTQLVSQLKNVRQETASKAKRINGLNAEVTGYTRKIQVQNQKLAELEERLKSLQNK